MQRFTIHPQTAIGMVALRVADLDRAQRFYSEVLGLRVLEREGPRLRLTADGARPLLELEALPGARPKPPRTTGLYHFAILTPDRRALARSLRRLLTLRYPLTGASDHGVSEALYLDDPDGNGIEIYHDRPRHAWPMQGTAVRMSVDPLDLDALLAELSDTEPWEGLDPATRIGHVHLHVADLRQAEAFYCDVLGFTLMQRYGNSASFVAAGGYHHHLGLNVWAGVGAPPPPPDAVGLRFFEIRLPTPAALEQVLTRVHAAGLTPQATPQGWLLRDPSQNALVLVADAQ
ncbi:VOC family protein [Kallotenue papyrolyticum]|uniref:VOC family protein n=1 Tax=Kallotenue papyrolyticum TaxID=1325125 RepID=UPI0005B8B544|nr:VOC family protein [Kallotenue papyrolyticum]